MAKRNIINLLDNSNIGKELKRALSFMLLSRGYTAEEIKVLDDYDFSVSKEASGTLLTIYKMIASLIEGENNVVCPRIQCALRQQARPTTKETTRCIL